MKTRQRYTTILAIGIVITLFSACVMAARGDDEAKGKDVLGDLEKAKSRLASGYQLAYHFSPGDVLRTKVVHLATVDTKIKGVSQTTKSRSVSTRAWRINSVDADGNITFDNVVERVQMWNEVEGRQAEIGRAHV